MSGAELLIVLAAVLAGSFTKAVTGMGFPIVAIPVTAMFVSLDDAVVVISGPTLLANAILATRELEHRHETRDLPVLAGAGVVGAVIGAVVFVTVPEEPLVLALVAIIVGYIVLFFAHPDRRITPATSRRWAPAAGVTAGLFQGAIGISGPVVTTWIHAYRLPRGAYILSITSLFLVSGVAQYTVLVSSGELAGRVVATLAAIPPTLVVIPLGTRLRDRLSSRAFDLSVLALLAVAAVTLLVRTFA